MPDLDAVVVATHLPSHGALVVAALERGLHVLCEKPMASTTAQCQEMIDASMRAQKLLAINFNTRSQAAYRQIHEILTREALGRIAVVRIAYLWSNHQWQPLERLEAFMANGGPIIDSGVHFFDGVQRFTQSRFARIDAQGAFLLDYEHPQHVIATCRMTSGAIALVEAGWLYTRNTHESEAIYQVEIIGEHGAIRADLMAGTIRVHTRQAAHTLPIIRSDKGFDWLYDQWATSIDAGMLLELASGEEGMAATQAAFEALASAHQHRIAMASSDVAAVMPCT